MAIFHSHASFQEGISLDIPWTIPTAIYQKSVNQIIGLDYPLCDFVVAKICFGVHLAGKQRIIHQRSGVVTITGKKDSARHIYICGPSI